MLTLSSHLNANLRQVWKPSKHSVTAQIYEYKLWIFWLFFALAQVCHIRLLEPSNWILRRSCILTLTPPHSIPKTWDGRILHSNSTPCTVEPLWCRKHFLHLDKVVGGVHLCLGAILWICDESNTYVATPVRPSSLLNYNHLDEEQGYWPCYHILR